MNNIDIIEEIEKFIDELNYDDMVKEIEKLIEKNYQRENADKETEMLREKLTEINRLKSKAVDVMRKNYNTIMAINGNAVKEAVKEIKLLGMSINGIQQCSGFYLPIFYDDHFRYHLYSLFIERLQRTKSRAIILTGGNEVNIPMLDDFEKILYKIVCSAEQIKMLITGLNEYKCIALYIENNL